uniref:L1 transposable element RRM domain-containing protein n=1 Tax=Pipistrellus kuhlii TaxID=59472 RepID=A0A7J8A9A1_PIPKU|nr:hypothetical protein mPipKuh1_008902 [Pipistrellus kuhlii]
MEKVFQEIMTENFPEIEKKKPTEIQDARRVPSKMNPKRPTHIIIKLANTNDKVRILKAARENQKVTYKGTPIRLATDFSTETHQARREWDTKYPIQSHAKEGSESKNTEPSKDITQSKLKRKSGASQTK